MPFTVRREAVWHFQAMSLHQRTIGKEFTGGAVGDDAAGVEYQDAPASL